jgi:hypothetical protein
VQQDLLLEPAKLRGGIKPEFLADSPAEPVETSQCICLSAGSVLGKHQLANRTFIEASLGDQPFEFADQLTREASFEIGVDTVLDAGLVKFFESRDFEAGEVVGHELLERVPFLQVERIAQVRGGSARIRAKAAGASPDKILELVSVEKFGIDDE